MRSWPRWFALAILFWMAWGPGLYGWPGNWAQAVCVALECGPSQGWRAVPLPQPLLEVKSKLSPSALGLASLSLESWDYQASWAPMAWLSFYTPPAPSSRLYLLYARLQTDGG